MISIERKQSRKKTRAPRRASGYVFLLSHFFVYEISFPGNRFNSISMEIRRENLQYWINNFVACGRACMQHNIHGQMELSMDTVVRPNVSGKKNNNRKSYFVAVVASCDTSRNWRAVCIVQAHVPEYGWLFIFFFFFDCVAFFARGLRQLISAKLNMNVFLMRLSVIRI